VVVNISLSIHIDPAVVQILLTHRAIANARRIVKVKYITRLLLLVADTDDPVPLGQIGVRIIGILGVVAILCRGPCLNAEQHRVPLVQSRSQFWRGSVLLCRDGYAVFLKKADNAAWRGSGFLVGAKFFLIGGKVPIGLVWVQPVITICTQVVPQV